jgi:hypothetical protein
MPPVRRVALFVAMLFGDVRDAGGFGEDVGSDKRSVEPEVSRPVINLRSAHGRAATDRQ